MWTMLLPLGMKVLPYVMKWLGRSGNAEWLGSVLGESGLDMSALGGLLSGGPGAEAAGKTDPQVIKLLVEIRDILARTIPVNPHPTA